MDKEPPRAQTRKVVRAGDAGGQGQPRAGLSVKAGSQAGCGVFAGPAPSSAPRAVPTDTEQGLTEHVTRGLKGRTGHDEHESPKVGKGNDRESGA